MVRVAEHKAVRSLLIWSMVSDFKIQDAFGRVSSEIPALEEQGSKAASELGQEEEEGWSEHGNMQWRMYRT